jgi:hypothetical protein
VQRFTVPELAYFGIYGAKCKVTTEQHEETTQKIWFLRVITETLLATGGAVGGVKSRPHSRHGRDCQFQIPAYVMHLGMENKDIKRTKL